MNSFDKLITNSEVAGARFVRRMYLMRMLGTFLCFLPILSVLSEHHRPVYLQVLLAINAFIWPTVAYLRAIRAPIPRLVEQQNLLLDAGVGGFWIAMMSLNPLPSVTIATILLTDRLSAGGVTLMRKAAFMLVSCFALSWVLTGMPFIGYVSQRTMLATLPLISLYVLALSLLTDGIAVRLRLKSQELERIAMLDPLLDIANRRLLEQRIAWELVRLQQHCGHSLLMFIDLDNFKEINDRYGHKVGDVMLKTVSQILQMATRATDTPARLGGDEFVILLPDTSLEEGRSIAQRIMDATSPVTERPDHSQTLTLSIGIAEALPEMLEVSDWLQAADNALYEAKRRGKNQIFAH
ncbi:diguanylate cyclase AdrA [Klebsiella sp. WP7-S18-CRE-02]|nr:diguanylate cyclase AdrA [Klebsiella sp. WP4-W18-ESBL-05]BBS91768.1 diguanylate cyclase AdrA [Klebsiella sp. WP7-S18-CRE-02]BBS96790.1 diguanylate cyclase AdrA [Klebsiella sp. WP7-S18-CRE-03]BBT01823.1 diguanylate cyclase AdrA [Klebsiella sp. WP7-S18-ESBL-04]